MTQSMLGSHQSAAILVSGSSLEALHQLDRAKTRVASYTRVAFAPDSAQAKIDRQQAAIQKFCDEHGLTLVAHHQDLGVSGNSLARPGLDELLRAAANGEIDAVAVTDLTRLARDGVVLLEIVESFRRAQVLVIALREYRLL